MRKFLLGLSAALALAGPTCLSQAQHALDLTMSGGPAWIVQGAASDCDFANQRYWNCALDQNFSIVRNSIGTDLRPTSASGASFNTFANTILRITSGSGLLVEDTRANFLLNNTVPATQTTASLTGATYTLWVNGSGSATMSAGSGTGCGTGVATQGSPVNFTITGAGTCTVTVSGSLNQFQLEPGVAGSTGFGTSFIPTAGSPVTRGTDNIAVLGSVANLIKNATGTILWTSLGVPTGATNARMLIGNGTVLLSNTAASTTAVRNNGNGVNLSATLGGATNIQNPTRIALGWSPAGRSIVGNNGTLATDANPQTNNTGSIVLGFNAGEGIAYDGYISRLSFLPVRLPDTILKAMTQ